MSDEGQHSIRRFMQFDTSMVHSKKSVQQMRGYSNARNGHVDPHQNSRVMKLDSNEATVSPSPRVMAALAEAVREMPLNWYPDVTSKKLNDKLAVYTDLPSECILTFNGSDHALENICRAYIEKDDEVLLDMPTYDHFRLYAESCDAQLVPVYGTGPFVPKTESLINSISDKTKIIYLVNPNNPTGVLYSEKDIRMILNAAPHSLVIVDEAYFEFCDVTMASLVHEYPNLIITRSFSKAFGLAGLRCGYVLSHPANLEMINKVRVGKNINTLAQVAATAALDDLEYTEHYVAEVTTARLWLSEKLKRKGLNVVDSAANFILVQVGNPSGVIRRLEEQQVYIRDRSQFSQLAGYIRITIGHQLLMERFWKIFDTLPDEVIFSQKHLAIDS